MRRERERAWIGPGEPGGACVDSTRERRAIAGRFGDGNTANASNVRGGTDVALCAAPTDAWSCSQPAGAWLKWVPVLRV